MRMKLVDYLAVIMSMKFTVRGLKTGSYPVHLHQDAASMMLDRFHKNITANGTLIIGENYDFALHIEGEGSFVCDRCATEFNRVIDTDIHIIYTDRSTGSDDALYEHIVDFNEMNVVDLTEDTHDALLLAIPMKILCRPDCQGIPLAPLEPEEDENTAILKQLFDKLASEERE